MNLQENTPRDTLDAVDEFNLNSIKDAINTFNIKQGWRNKSNEIKEVLLNNAPHLISAFENYLIGTMIALIMSELGEALEAARKNLNDDHLPHRKGLEVELADAVIRIFDMAGYLGLDIGAAIVEKDQYNRHRQDHKITNREKDGGKKF
jgi:NTP pyrophosphatase (non-canonical NTP hydrolase)